MTHKPSKEVATKTICRYEYFSSMRYLEDIIFNISLSLRPGYLTTMLVHSSKIVV